MNISGIDNEGKLCIKIMDNTPVIEMFKLCETLEKGLKAKGYNIGMPQILFDSYVSLLYIPIRDNEEILSLRYMINEQKDCFYLVPEGLQLPDEYIDELWDDFYEKIVNDIFEILSK